jgi:hypothetical protein
MYTSILDGDEIGVETWDKVTASASVVGAGSPVTRYVCEY